MMCLNSFRNNIFMILEYSTFILGPVQSRVLILEFCNLSSYQDLLEEPNFLTFIGAESDKIGLDPYKRGRDLDALKDS